MQLVLNHVPSAAWAPTWRLRDLCTRPTASLAQPARTPWLTGLPKPLIACRVPLDKDRFRVCAPLAILGGSQLFQQYLTMRPVPCVAWASTLHLQSNHLAMVVNLESSHCVAGWRARPATLHSHALLAHLMAHVSLVHVCVTQGTVAQTVVKSYALHLVARARLRAIFTLTSRCTECVKMAST